MTAVGLGAYWDPDLGRGGGGFSWLLVVWRFGVYWDGGPKHLLASYEYGVNTIA
jgi:hypothetical protein